MTSQSGNGQQGAANNETSTFKQLLSTEVRIPPNPDLLATLAVKDYQELYDEAARDP